MRVVVAALPMAEARAPTEEQRPMVAEAAVMAEAGMVEVGLARAAALEAWAAVVVSACPACLRAVELRRRRQRR